MSVDVNKIEGEPVDQLVADKSGAVQEGSVQEEAISEAIDAENSTVVEKVVEATDGEATVAEEPNVETVSEVAESSEAEMSDEDGSISSEAAISATYGSMNRPDLLVAFRELIASEECHKRVAEVRFIRDRYYTLKNEELAQQKSKFIDDGGLEDDFKPQEDLYETEFKTFNKEFNAIFSVVRVNREKERENNLKVRLQIIEDIKGLTEREESLGKTFNEFRDLQDRWKKVGPVPQAEANNLWKTYHHSVEIFFDYIDLNKELRDLDFKKNLERKEDIITAAKELVEGKDIVKVFNELQGLHDEWKDVGPVEKSLREPLWERFKDTSRLINKRYQDYFESRKQEEAQNAKLKEDLCLAVEALIEETFSSAKEWDLANSKILELQEAWKKVGYIRRRDSEKLWSRFRKGNDSFFNKKRDFWNLRKEETSNNYQKKVNLCEQAEALQESSDWKETTDKLIQLQKEWKSVGPVSRKSSDSVWKRFRAACDYFFNRKSESKNDAKAEEKDNLELKRKFIEALDGLELSGDPKSDLSILAKKRAEWRDFGHVPFKDKDKINGQFRKSMDRLYSSISADENEKAIINLRSKLESLGDSKSGVDKIYDERDFLERKLKTIEAELLTAQNNIGFFSSNGGAFIEKLQKSIIKLEDQKAAIVNKLKVVSDVLKG